jgi:hypothetical protein
MLVGCAMRYILPAALLAATLATGCYAETTGSVGYGVTATTVAPDLVYVSPGVQVIADYDEPVFYADNFYWRQSGGVWYRSSYHTGGWIYASPPRTVLSINNPYNYRHYRPQGYVRGGYRQPYRESRPAYRNGPVVRDHRQPVYQTRPAPVQRDHRRFDKRDHRR